ncbi:MAG: cation:proton antiporter [Planctomycetota bacterium]
MPADFAAGIAALLVLGAGAQWIAWRVRVPAILLLLATGILIGPVFGLLDPDRLFGEALLPLVSVAVALILFEGGLGLHLREIQELKGTLVRLVTVGAAITWFTATAAAHWLLGIDVAVSFLLGATLVVTGPTVIGPLLRHIRPTGPSAGLLKWEGIVIDPIGATLALLVFEVVVATSSGEASRIAALGIGRTIAIGGVLGAAGAGSIYLLIRRYWVPDFLQIPVVLALVVGLFVLSNRMQHESGFLTVTVMGGILGNQRRVSIAHVLEFKENLRTLLISSLFILLSARVDFATFAGLGWSVAAFVAVIVLVARPLSILASTLGSPLGRADRLFLAWMAPRGIVAAAVASVFALQLEAAGIADADRLVSGTIAVIVGTVALYGLTASWVARRLGVAGPAPQGIFLLGAHEWARSLAKRLQDAGFRVLLADTNRENLRKAKMEGLKTWSGNALAESALESIDFGGIGRMLALTPNDEVNHLGAQRGSELFGRAGCFRLAGPDDKTTPGAARTHDVGGRVAFEADMTFRYVQKRWDLGARFKLTRLTDEFDYAAFRRETKETARLLFLIRGDTLRVNAGDQPLAPKPGDSIVSLADPSPAAEPAA